MEEICRKGRRNTRERRKRGREVYREIRWLKRGKVVAIFPSRLGEE